MRGLAISKHIGIRDLQSLFPRIDHSLDIHSYSFHSHIFGWHQHPVDYDAAKLLDPAYCKAWYNSHEQFHGYDFYVSFYEPMSILLFEESHKPLIMVCPIRAFFPFENQIPEARAALHRIDVTIVANSRYDQEYFRALCDIPCQYIPSICDYLNITWTGTKAEWLLDWRGCPLFEIDDCKPVKELGLYDYKDFYSYKGYIEVDPRQVNTMSFFERYAAGMPMMYPTKRFLKQMGKSALSELHFSSVKGGNPVVSLGLADYYQWPYIILFDSIPELIRYSYPEGADVKQVHDAMLLHHKQVTADALKQWAEVLSD